VGTVRDTLQLPDMRRIELGYGLSITGELAGTVALVVYAAGAGGAALVAAYAARTLAAMGVARRPAHSDRHGRAAIAYPCPGPGGVPHRCHRHSTSVAAADALAARRLSTDPPGRSDGSARS